MGYLYMPFGSDVLEDAIKRACDSDVEQVYKYFYNAGTSEIAYLECLKYLYKNPIFYTLSAIHSIENESNDNFKKRHLYFLELAASQGDGLALLALAVYSETGDFDYPLDDDKAEEYYKKSSEAGLAWSCFVYGYFYLRRNKQTEEKGLELIQYAANQGLEDAIDFINKMGVHAPK